MSIKDRAKGAFIGSLIGEALGVGPHWFYDLEEQYKHYGEWIDNYTRPLPDRYHPKLNPGDLSQQGWIIKQFASFLDENKGYDEVAFLDFMDNKILPNLDGTATGGYGGYTSEVMRYVFQKRVKENLKWGTFSSKSDDTESLERIIPAAIYYSNDLDKLGKIATSNVSLTQNEHITVSMSVAFNALVALLIQGEELNQSIGLKLMKRVYNNGKGYSSPDALLSPSYMAAAAEDKNIQIEPAWKVSLVYGMPCAINHVLPAAYYLAARFKDNFKDGVLHALNGGGQNQIRAMLTGALIGAQVGLSNIPEYLIEGLTEKEELLDLAERITAHLE